MSAFDLGYMLIPAFVFAALGWGLYSLWRVIDANAAEVLTAEQYETFEQALARKPKRKAKNDEAGDGREPKEKRKHVI